MAADVDPIVGNWYHRLDKGQDFEVVAYDDDSGIVEIQHSDGDIEEIDIETWYGFELEVIENPGDYVGPLDDEDDLDDLEFDETDIDEDDWDEP